MGHINESLQADWNQQLIMLKELVNADVAFLVGIDLIVVATSNVEDTKFGLKSKVSDKNNRILEVIKKGDFCFSNDDGSFITAPVIKSDKSVWGVLVINSSNEFAGKKDAGKILINFCKIINDRIELEELHETNGVISSSELDLSSVEFLLKASNGVLWKLDYASYKFTFLGQYAKDILSYSIDDWSDFESWKKCVYPEDKERVLDFYHKKVLVKEDHMIDYRLVKKDESVIWVRDIVKLIRNNQNEVVELIGCKIDITHLKQKEEDIELLNNRLKYILTATNTILSISDENGNLIFHSHEDIAKIKVKCFEHFTENSDRCARCPRRNKVKRKSTFLYENEGKTIQVVAFPYEVSPNIWNIAEVRVDISELISNKTEIAELKDRLNFSMSAGNIAYFEYSFANYHVLCNSIFEEVTGFNCNDQVVDIEWFKSRIHEGDIGKVVGAYQNAVKSADKKMTVEYRFLNAENKYIWMRFSGLLQVDDVDVKKLSGIFIDISDTKNLMVDLLNERNKSLQASDAKSMFLANMSHEIRTPMNAIIGFSELLSKKITEPTLVGFLNSIKASGNVLLDLINDLLDLEKIEAGKMIIRKENTQFVLLLTEMEQTFSLRFSEKQVGLSIKIEPNFPKLIYIDSLKIKQILLNLVNNALKFTVKGQVSVSSSFNFDNTGQKGTLMVQVKDTGIGIGKERQDKIFEPFVQNKDVDQKEHQGTGLGLSIVQKLVNMMGGLISLESEKDIGSNFTILIPDVEASNDLFSEIEGSVESDVKFSNERVVIIDNVETNREVLSAMCTNLNLQCQTNVGDQNVIGHIETFMPKVIIMDIRNQKKTDFKMFKEIKKVDKIKEIPIIAISSSSNANELELAFSVGYNGFISKPIPEQKLVRELSKFISPLNKLVEIVKKEEVVKDYTGVTEKDKEEIIQYFKEEIIPLWGGLKEMLSSKKLKLFLQGIQKVNAKVQWSALDDYEEKMETAIKSFDFETIQKLINRFQIFVDEFK